MKTRSNAAELVEKGRVRLNGQRQTSPGHLVKTGDVLTVALDRIVRVMHVVAFAERRGDADQARTLYSELNARAESDDDPHR